MAIFLSFDKIDNFAELFESPWFQAEHQVFWTCSLQSYKNHLSVSESDYLEDKSLSFADTKRPLLIADYSGNSIRECFDALEDDLAFFEKYQIQKVLLRFSSIYSSYNELGELGRLDIRNGLRRLEESRIRSNVRFYLQMAQGDIFESLTEIKAFNEQINFNTASPIQFCLNVFSMYEDLDISPRLLLHYIPGNCRVLFLKKPLSEHPEYRHLLALLHQFGLHIVYQVPEEQGPQNVDLEFLTELDPAKLEETVSENEDSDVSESKAHSPEVMEEPEHPTIEGQFPF